MSSLTTSLVNINFPDGFINLRAPKGEGFIVDSYPGTGHNTKWEFVPVGKEKPGLFYVVNTAEGGVKVGIAEEDLVQIGPPIKRIYQVPVFAGGPRNEFVTSIMHNGVMISLPEDGERPSLYWTLDSDLFNTPIRLMELRKDHEIRTQIWHLEMGEINISLGGSGNSVNSDTPQPAGSSIGTYNTFYRPLVPL